jgi:hypothetical protein
MSENLLYDGRCEDKVFINYDFPDDGIARAEARAFRADAKAFNLLSLYEHAILKNLAALKTMQKERCGEAASQPAARPKTVKPPAQPVEIAAPAPANGFDYSTPTSASSPPQKDACNDTSNMAA